MKYLIILFLALNFFAFPQQINIKGKVLDLETNQPLSDANIRLKNDPAKGTSSGLKGNFELENIPANSVLLVTYLGYFPKEFLIVNAQQDIIIKLEPKVIASQTVLIEGSLGKKGVTPLAFDKIERKEIEENYTVQDLPEFLSYLPSATFYSEGGSGIGYNYLSIRGFDQRRISVSINGIPQNDPEDHNVYWLDFPDLLASADLIQVQRGAGSGVTGYPAIGGSINIITSTFSNKPKIDLSASLGSYNTRKYSASFSSGLINKKYSIYAKLSQILSTGYRNLSWIKFNSYHLSAVRYDDNFTTQINFYGGPIEDGLAYTGLPKFAVKDKYLRRSNFSYWETDNNKFTYTLLRRPEEIENFSQPHFELLNEFQINENLKFNSALFLVTGKGFFDYDGSWADTSYLRLTNENGFNTNANPGNVLIRAQVENTQYGWIPRLSYKHNNGELIFGGEIRKHKSIHWGSINYGENLPAGLTKNYRYYFYNGAKDIFNGFVHETYDLNKNINLLGEIQLAYHKYKLYNEKFVGTEFEIGDLFFNPRFGINYRFDENKNIFFSFARVSREPRLKNYYDAAESSGGAVPQFEQNIDGSYNFDKPIVTPEIMNDFELGASLNSENISLTFNLFYMLFNDEIVKNGELDRFGQPVTGNVDKTVHTGIEFSLIAKPFKEIEIFGNISYSKNTIEEGKYFIDMQNYIELSGNRISGFPDFLANFGVNYDNSGFYLRLTGKYVGAFYSDNYDANLSDYLKTFPGFVSYTDNKNEAYFTSDFFASYEVNLFKSISSSKVFIQVNNIFDNLYSAYAIGAEFFPAAERNFLAGIQLGL